jgi:hypothetical protein
VGFWGAILGRPIPVFIFAKHLRRKYNAGIPMPHDIKESDWKIIRDLNPIAVERYYERTVAKIASIVAAADKTGRERFFEIAEVVKNDRSEAAYLFDELRRSNALLKLTLLHAQQLVTEKEFSQFSPETREIVKAHRPRD